MGAGSSGAKGDERAKLPSDGEARTPDFDDAELGKSRFASWLSRAHNPSSGDRPEPLPRGVEVTWGSASSPDAMDAKREDALREDSVTIVVPPIAYYNRWLLLFATVCMAGISGASIHMFGGMEGGGGFAILMTLCLTLFVLAGTLWGFFTRTLIQASPTELLVRHTVALGQAPRRFSADRVEGVRWNSTQYKYRTQQGVGMEGTQYRVWATVEGKDVALIKTEHVILASLVARSVRRCLNHPSPGGDGSPKKVRFDSELVEIFGRTPDAIADELIEAGHHSFAAEKFGQMLAENWAATPEASAKASQADDDP